MNYDAERLKQTQLTILDYIVDACERHRIPYYLFFGSLLGAVRHSGYIPWDDDLDIACVRDDYEKLISVLKEELPMHSEFFIQDLATDPKSPMLHTKVRMNGTVCIERNTVSEEQHKGIFVDIFPLDGFRKGVASRLRAKSVRLLYSARGNALFKNRKRSVKRLLCAPLSHFDVKRYNTCIHRLMTHNRPDECKELTCYICRYKADRICISRDWLEPAKKLSFEDHKYAVPHDTDAVLTKLYGSNYMMLPPEDKRVTHAYQEVSWQD